MSLGNSVWNAATKKIDIFIPPADEGQKTAGSASITITCTTPTAKKKVIMGNPANNWTSGGAPGGVVWPDSGVLYPGGIVISTLTQQNQNAENQWIAGPDPIIVPNGNTTTYTFANNGITNDGGQTSIVVTMQQSGGGL
jgi:hypothetical protein